MTILVIDALIISMYIGTGEMHLRVMGGRR